MPDILPTNCRDRMTSASSFCGTSIYRASRVRTKIKATALPAASMGKTMALSSLRRLREVSENCVILGRVKNFPR